MENTGIFTATSKAIPERQFIFSAIDGNEIWQIHLAVALKGKHPIKRLQDHFRENPSDEFKIEMLWKCPKQDFIHYTNHFIKRLKPYFNQKSKAKK